MTQTITPKQTLFLWRLLVEPGGVFVGSAKPELTAKERNQLSDLGLISLEKRKSTPKSRATNFAVLSEKGWNWASENLDAPLPKTGTAALGVLSLFLCALKKRVKSGELSLAKLLTAPSPAVETEELGPNLAYQARQIEDTLAQIAGGMPHEKRIRLADLRARLPDLPRAAVDRLLLDWEHQGKAALYPMDDPREIEQADELAAIPNSTGKNRHIIYLKSR